MTNKIDRGFANTLAFIIQISTTLLNGERMQLASGLRVNGKHIYGKCHSYYYI